MTSDAYRIEDAKPWHCGRVARNLRAEHKRQLINIGVDAHREISRCFSISAWKKTWFKGDTLLGIGGITGGLIDPIALVWLAITDEGAAHPKPFLQGLRRTLPEVMAVRRQLITTIIPSDKAALRLAVHLGFHLAEEGDGRKATNRLGRERLLRYIQENREIRIPYGQGGCVAMAFHYD